MIPFTLTLTFPHWNGLLAKCTFPVLTVTNWLFNYYTGIIYTYRIGVDKKTGLWCCHDQERQGINVCFWKQEGPKLGTLKLNVIRFPFLQQLLLSCLSLQCLRRNNNSQKWLYKSWQKVTLIDFKRACNV